jgi:hypothetical protein
MLDVMQTLWGGMGQNIHAVFVRQLNAAAAAAAASGSGSQRHQQPDHVFVLDKGTGLLCLMSCLLSILLPRGNAVNANQRRHKNS